MRCLLALVLASACVTAFAGPVQMRAAGETVSGAAGNGAAAGSEAAGAGTATAEEAVSGQSDNGAAGTEAAGNGTAANNTAGSGVTGTATGAAAGSAQQESRSGWLEKNGSTYYLDSQGKKVTGWKTIGDGRYYFRKAGRTKGQMLTGWQTIGSGIYYFRKAGKTKGQMLTGLQTIEKKQYYLIPSGKTAGRMAVGWQMIGGGRYYFRKAGKTKGQMLTGWQTIGRKQYYFMEAGKTKGQMVTGWQTIDGKSYYFNSSGQALTGWMIQGKTCYYFDEDGAMDPKKTVNSSRSGDSTGSAADKTLRRAQAIVANITTEKMTKEEKLWTCFNYVMKTYTGRRPRTPHYCGMDWPVVYANDMFLDGSGNCFSYAAAFAYLAKACGYTNVYACNSTGHGWTEIDGLIYDPEEYRNTKYKYYGTSYSSVPGYRRGISAGLGFMHVKI